MTVTKEDLIEGVSNQLNITKKEARRAVNSTIDTMKIFLKGGQKLQIHGFITIEVKEKKGGQRRVPVTGQRFYKETYLRPWPKISKKFVRELNNSGLDGAL